jgi:hypothetical protein
MITPSFDYVRQVEDSWHIMLTEPQKVILDTIISNAQKEAYREGKEDGVAQEALETIKENRRRRD